MGRVRHVSWLCESAQSINRSKICTQCCPNAAACCCFMGLPLPKCFPFLWLYFFATGSLTGTWQDLWPRVEWNVLTFRSNCRNWETNDRQSDWQIDWRQRLVVLSNICICRINTPCAHCAHSVLDPCVFVCLFTFNPLTPLDECSEQGLAWPGAEPTQITHSELRRGANKTGRSLMACSSHWHGHVACKSPSGAVRFLIVVQPNALKHVEQLDWVQVAKGLREGESEPLNQFPPNLPHIWLSSFSRLSVVNTRFIVYLIFTFTKNAQTCWFHSLIHAAKQATQSKWFCRFFIYTEKFNLI